MFIVCDAEQKTEGHERIEMIHCISCFSVQLNETPRCTAKQHMSGAIPY